MKKVLVIDQGTTSSRAIVFSVAGALLAAHQIESTQFFPSPGWVEQDPENIWFNVITCCQRVLQQVGAADILGIGITNQRETTLVWERETGKCIYNAIVWQDRRTTEWGVDLKKRNLEPLIHEKTGLFLDPYFSATKIMWILNHYPGAIERAQRGELLFGTVDCYLLWQLTNGKIHATDITNASRTMLFNIKEGCWDDELLAIFSVPRAMLPEVKANCEHFGVTDKHLFGQELPILAMIGDQQSAMIGQNCLEVGTAKCTYGTGGFLMCNTGEQIACKNQLITTIAYKIDHQTHYAIEGSIFAAGSIITWLVESLKFAKLPCDTEVLAKSLPDNGGVYFVPAFTGLGAPYWDPYAKGGIYGLTLNTTPAHIVRAGLEAIAYQTKDLLDDLLKHETYHLKHLRVDGGVTVNAWLMQFLAGVLQLPIIVNPIVEATALGVACLVAYSAGYCYALQGITMPYKGLEKTFYPSSPIEIVRQRHEGWLWAVARTRTTT